MLGEESAPVAAVATAAPAVVPVAEPACSAVFIDTGANLGHQIRMLYEPNLYPGNPAESIFGDVFGADASSRQSVCAYGFEPSPVHERRLEALEAAYRKKGYTVSVYTTTAASTTDGVATVQADELTTVDLASWMADTAAQATRLVLKANSEENSEPGAPPARRTAPVSDSGSACSSGPPVGGRAAVPHQRRVWGALLRSLAAEGDCGAARGGLQDQNHRVAGQRWRAPACSLMTAMCAALRVEAGAGMRTCAP